jgi:hypothetical protein
MDYKDNPAEYLATISPVRVKTVRYPSQWWKGRARCFRLFNKGLMPSHISNRQCKVSRRTLYRYYQDWKILKAKRNIILQKSKPEQVKKYGTECVITIPNI